MENRCRLFQPRWVVSCQVVQLPGVTPQTVANTRQRWVKEKSLEDKPRSGRVKRLDGKQGVFLVALAGSDAPEGFRVYW